MRLKSNPRWSRRVRAINGAAPALPLVAATCTGAKAPDQSITTMSQQRGKSSASVNESR